MKGQWYFVNHLKNSNVDNKENNKESNKDDSISISIVLEDDIVVSPFFFLWIIRSTNAYYTESQQELHKKLKEAIYLDILDNPTSTTHSKNLTTHHINKFYKDRIGEPLILGISLSKQYLDSTHHPMELEIRNNFSPFLYRYLLFLFIYFIHLFHYFIYFKFSIVGTWGTVIFPEPWNAFVEWWKHRENIKDYSPIVEGDLITNTFYLNNPSIWSPWMIK